MGDLSKSFDTTLLLKYTEPGTNVNHDLFIKLNPEELAALQTAGLINSNQQGDHELVNFNRTLEEALKNPDFSDINSVLTGIQDRVSKVMGINHVYGPEGAPKFDDQAPEIVGVTNMVPPPARPQS